MKKKHILFHEQTTLRSSGREILPPLLESFLAGIDSVCLDEHHVESLHAQRLRGKRLRYAMEMYIPAYSDSFAKCLDSVKEMLSIMGRIHDIDINLPVLQRYAKQVRHFNALVNEPSLKMPASLIRNLIKQFELERHESFLSLCLGFSRWKEEYFQKEFIHSISLKDNHDCLSAAARNSSTARIDRIPKR